MYSQCKGGRKVSNIRWILSYVNIIKWLFFLGFTLIVLKTLSNLTLIGIQKFIIDDIFIEGKYDMLPLILIIFGLSIISFNALHAIAARVLDNNGYQLNRIISKGLMAILHKTPTEIYQNERTAKYVNYFTNDIDLVSKTISQQIPKGIEQLTSFVILSFVVGFASPVILISILLLSVIYIGLGKYFAPRLKVLSREVQETKSDFLVHIEEGISSTREVVAFHRLKWEKNVFNKLFMRYFETVINEGKFNNRQIVYGDSLKWIATFIILGYGGYLVIKGQLSLGMFVIVYQFSSQLMDSLQGMYDFVMSISSKMASVDRVRHVMEGDLWKEGEHKIEGSIGKITLNKIHFKYSNDNKFVLKGLSLNIPVGKKIGIVGTSGGGKSTIAQLLVRSFEPQHGEILINGLSLNQIKRNDWAHKISIVFQEPYLFPDTIKNNLILGREDVTNSYITHVCKAVKIHDFIHSLENGYDTEVGERGVMLSGGQRQRLALARALLSNTEVLILDEATSALDLETEREVFKNLDLLREGRTTIIIAHRLSTIQNSDIIYVMDQGKVVEEGTHEELMYKDNVYKNLITAQAM